MLVVAEEDRVNHGWTTSGNGHASHCHRRGRWATITTNVKVKVDFKIHTLYSHLGADLRTANTLIVG